MRYEVRVLGNRFAVFDHAYQRLVSGRWHRSPQAQDWIDNERRRRDLIAVIAGRGGMPSRERARLLTSTDYYGDNERVARAGSEPGPV